MRRTFQRVISLILAIAAVACLLPMEISTQATTTSCDHTYTGRGKCSACGFVYDFLSTRKETSAVLQPVTGTIWVMDAPYSAGSGGRNLLDSNGNKIATKEAMHVSATVTNAYGNTWCQLILEDGRVGYAYADGSTIKQEQIIKFTKLITPKKSIYTNGNTTSTSVAGTKIVSVTGHPIKKVSARILKVDAYGNEITLSDFSKAGINNTSYTFPKSLDQLGKDLLSFSSLSKKNGAYIYEIVVTADPGQNADTATQAACTLTMRYPFIVKDSNSRILTLHYNDGTGRTKQILVSKGSNIALPAFRRNGDTFVGWANSETAATAEKTAGEFLTLSSDQVLYAVWKAGEDITAESMVMSGYTATTKSPSTYKKAVTYADVEEIVKDYYKTISDNENKTVYWTANLDSLAMETKAFAKTVKESGCKHSTRACTSNLFSGVGSVNDTGTGAFAVVNDRQCSAFAAYMAYVVFKTRDPGDFTLCYGTGANSLKNKANDEIKPGSVMRWYSSSYAHSYFIYKIEGDTAYCIECNTTSGDCKIRYEVKRSVAEIKKQIEDSDGKYTGLFSSPAVMVEGDYTISFNANKPADAAKVTGTMQPQKMKIGGEAPLPANTFAVSDYLFTGWNTHADGSGKAFTDSETVKNITQTPGSTVVLYAQWKNVDRAYTIQYLPNGGKGTMETTLAMFGEAVNLRSNTFTKPCYVFTGWNTSADGTGTAYTDGQQVQDLTKTSNAVVSLYAQWRVMSAEEYLKTCTQYTTRVKVKSIGSSASLMTHPINLSSGMAVRQLTAGETLLATALYQNTSGEYWYQVTADKDGKTGFVYAGDTEFVSLADKTATYSVTLDTTKPLKGKINNIRGSVSYKYGRVTKLVGKLDDSDSKTSAQTASITSGFTNIVSTSINNNLSFGKLSAGPGTLTLTATVECRVSDGKTLSWKSATASQKVLKFTVIGSHAVTYKSNTTDAVENMPAAQTKKDLTNLTLSTKQPVREGYIFLGWATSANATTAEYQPGAVYKKDAALTLYALWQKEEAEPVAYTVSYSSALAASNMPASQTKTQGQTLTLSAEIPACEGYTFLGWATSADATAAQYQPGDAYELDADLNLYALWQQEEPGEDPGEDPGEAPQVTYTISYSSDVTDVYLPESQTKVHGEPLTLSSETPWSQYYTFKGWEAQINGEKVMFQPGDTFTLDTAVTLHAVWGPAGYVYDANGGRYFELCESFKEVSAFDISDMCHITISFDLSDDIIAMFGSEDAWFEAQKPFELGSWDFIPMELKNKKMDFYVTAGTWISLVDDINCNYTFEQDENIVLDVQLLQLFGNGGLLDENDPLTDMVYIMFVPGRQHDVPIFSDFVRTGYTLLGWHTDPNADTALYAHDTLWSKINPSHTKLYAVWQKNDSQ